MRSGWITRVVAGDQEERLLVGAAGDRLVLKAAPAVVKVALAVHKAAPAAHRVAPAAHRAAPAAHRAAPAAHRAARVDKPYAKWKPAPSSMTLKRPRTYGCILEGKTDPPPL